MNAYLGIDIGTSGCKAAVFDAQGQPLALTRREYDELAKKAAYFCASGASILDLGMLSGIDSSKKIAEIIGAARSAVDIPLSIDSLNSKEILAAVDAGIDLGKFYFGVLLHTGLPFRAVIA